MAAQPFFDHSERDSIIAEVRELYDAAYPVKESGVFTRHDWRRCEAALDVVHGPTVLDVGIGAGQIFNTLARRRDIDRLIGLDIALNQKLIRPPRADIRLMSILNLEFEDRSFDSVVCMEVLEHLEIIDFPKALEEVRRVCRSTLIVTVPYNEPEPVWHHDRRGGHRQSFSEEKIARFFPRAERLMLYNGKKNWRWVMLIERY